MSGIRRGYVGEPGAQIHYAEAGPPDGPPVVLLHQTPRSWDEYREVLPLLADAGFRALAPDTVGMGASDPTADTIEAYAEGVARFVDELGLARVDLVGHHTGGVIAIEVAARWPERVNRLVLSSTPLVDAANRERRAARTGPGVDEVEVRDDGGHLVDLWRGRAAFYPEGRPDILQRFVADALRVADPHAGHRAVARYVMEDRLPNIGANVLVVGHEADPHAFGAMNPLAAALGAETAVIAGGVVPLERTAAAFARVVVAFLR